MPIIESKYKPSFLFKNKHIQSIYPTVFRRIKDVDYTRERIFTPDDDFLDPDWSTKANEKLIALVPGLEASSRTKYIQGIIHAFNKKQWSTVVFNPCGLSGEILWENSKKISD